MAVATRPIQADRGIQRPMPVNINRPGGDNRPEVNLAIVPASARTAVTTISPAETTLGPARTEASSVPARTMASPTSPKFNPSSHNPSNPTSRNPELVPRPITRRFAPASARRSPIRRSGLNLKSSPAIRPGPRRSSHRYSPTPPAPAGPEAGLPAPRQTRPSATPTDPANPPAKAPAGGKTPDPAAPAAGKPSSASSASAGKPPRPTSTARSSTSRRGKTPLNNTHNMKTAQLHRKLRRSYFLLSPSSAPHPATNAHRLRKAIHSWAQLTEAPGQPRRTPGRQAP